MNAPANLAEKLRELEPARSAAEAESFLAAVPRHLAAARKLLLEADASFRRNNAELVLRYADERQQLEANHATRVEQLRGIIARLEALRQ
jgi:hypothetical protein